VQNESGLSQAVSQLDRVRREIAKIIVGQQDIVDGVLICLMAGGHVLLEGVPGLGKTTLLRTLGQVLHLRYSRIQFTPDLMPADIVGSMMIETDERGARALKFQPGPIFSHLVLADEINRATPKTQSALLEAMQEHSVTVAGHTHKLSEPFFVMATQNPLEMEGTYPLPEAQLDRFFCKLLVKYPLLSELETILDRTTEAANPRAEPVLAGERILEMSSLARQIPIATEIRRYGLAIVMATHPEHELAADITRRYVRYGASPRGAQALILGAKIRAILDHRYHVAKEDLRAMAPAVLRHRLILNFEGQAEAVATDTVVEEILQTVAQPKMVA